jgi:GNAT superfamily N-acetyltransferase
MTADAECCLCDIAKHHAIASSDCISTMTERRRWVTREKRFVWWGMVYLMISLITTCNGFSGCFAFRYFLRSIRKTCPSHNAKPSYQYGTIHDFHHVIIDRTISLLPVPMSSVSPVLSPIYLSLSSLSFSSSSSSLSSSSTASTTTTSTTTTTTTTTTNNGAHRNTFTHADLLWKIRPPKNLSWFTRQKLRIHLDTLWFLHTFQKYWYSLYTRVRSSNSSSHSKASSAAIRSSWIDQALWYFAMVGHYGMKQVMLEVYDGGDDATIRRPTKMGRFGITTQMGPSTVPLQQAVQQIWGSSSGNSNATALAPIHQFHIQQPSLVCASAIIYMFVEEQYRGRGLGHLALDVIAYLHGSGVPWDTLGCTDTKNKYWIRPRIQCDYTVLVADDKSSDQRLVQWYERTGLYFRAPLLQEAFGSPNEIYGITMIGETRSALPSTDCRIEWQW